VLRAVVLQGGRELLSADTRSRHRLGGPSSIQTSLAALVKQDLLLKEGPRYVVVDSLLREWVARKDLLTDNPLSMTRFLARLGLPTPELRAWAMYDWANSAFWSTVVTAVFRPSSAATRPPACTPRGHVAVCLGHHDRPHHRRPHGAGARRARRSSAPQEAAAPDLPARGRRRHDADGHDRAGEWIYALVLFMVANVGVASTLVFYDSLLPHIARPDEIDRASTAGFAIGFTGGGVLLLINLAWILKPALFGLPDATAAVRLTFASVGVGG
jgi:UMF1 family MFS transporter